MKHTLAAALLILFASSVAFGQCGEADRQKLIAFDKAWSEAAQRGDRALLQNFFADDYVSPSPAGTQTKAQVIDGAVRAAELRRPDPQNAQNVSDHYIVTCTPNTATITHRNVVTRMVDGKERSSYSRSVHILEKRGGDWKVVSDAGHPLDDGGQLLYMEMDWADAVKRKDKAWLERHYAEGFISVNPEGTLNNRRADIEDLQNVSFDSMEASDMQVRVNGDTAVVTGVSTVKGKYKNQDIGGRYRFIDTFVKRDGEWKILSSQATRIAQPQTAQK